LGVNRPEREAAHLHLAPTSIMRGNVPPLYKYVFMAWCSVKAQGQLYLLPLVFLSEISPLNTSDNPPDQGLHTTEPEDPCNENDLFSYITVLLKVFSFF